jgi:ubiquinone/menaquinone biosynthesis C-methylase UbiE
VNFFTTAAGNYDRHIGRYGPVLAPELIAAADVRPGEHVLDVGCGPGALTAVLLKLGAVVTAVDPSEPFVTACTERNPAAEVRQAAAEDLPFEADRFDAALAQLVVNFMQDAPAGLAEMARVTRPGGVVAACMWDIPGGGMTMLSTFWRAVRTVDPGTEGETARVGVREGQIAELLEGAGLEDVRSGTLATSAHYEGFDDFWEPFTFAVGPAGSYLRKLPADGQAAVRSECFALLGEPGGPFDLDARAWYARGTVPG